MQGVPSYLRGLRVPGPNDCLTLHTLGVLSDQAVRRRVAGTLARYPALQRIYDTAFIEWLIPKRQNLDNELLLWLADANDCVHSQLLAEIESDLLILERVGSFERFRGKLRQRKAIPLNSAKTELELAAWMRRRRHDITLEPLDPKTGKLCEFAMDGKFPTFWEVKSIVDDPEIVAEVAAQNEIRKRLATFNEPYVIQVNFGRPIVADPQGAARNIRAEIRKFRNAGSTNLPHTFSEQNTGVTILGRSDRNHGYLRFSMANFAFNEYDAYRVLRIATSAQIPAGGTGIVVLDTSLADFFRGSILDTACYGERAGHFITPPNRLTAARRPPAIFQPGVNTRYSAVIHYRRRINAGQIGVTKEVFRNPFGANLAPDFLADFNVTQHPVPRYRLATSRELEPWAPIR